LKWLQRKDILYKLGKYYRVYAHNYDEMKRYWNAAISAGCGKSAFALGEYFQFTEDDYTGMLWCYNKAIEFGVIAAMYAMAAYHYDITKNYEEMMKYYKMVLDKADRFTPREKMYYANALFDIGTYYRDVECNEELVNSYMIEAFNNGCRDAYEYLPTYFTDELTVFR